MLEQVSDGTRRITLGADKGYQESISSPGCERGKSCRPHAEFGTQCIASRNWPRTARLAALATRR